MSELTYLIYKHTSPSGKSYIGQTNNLSRRTASHRRCESKCTVFNNAIRKHGWHSFTTEILANHLTLSEANELEERLITEHNTQVPNGYNLLPGGTNHQHSEETKQKLSKANKGKSNGPRSEETKLKISSAQKGKKLSPEHLLKIQQINASRRGQPISDEHLRKIRENGILQRGRPAHNKGKPVSEETKLKIQRSQAINAENRKGCKRCIDPVTGKISYRKLD